MNRMQKVTAFITREGQEGKELLLFQHPYAGIQVPAGTVRVDERIEIAVLREAWEETGLADLRMVSKLDSRHAELPPDERWILRATKLFTEPAFDASGVEGALLLRGTPVKCLSEHEKFAHIAYEAYDFNSSPPELLNRVEGYVRRSLLDRGVTRYFYHLHTNANTSTEWNVPADGHIFRCFWVPLTPKPFLTERQQAWLDRVYELLVASANQINLSTTH